jgi:queuine tRNA-ribosyltransferase
MLFTRNGIINIKNNKWRDDFSPVDPDGTSFVDHQYSRAYLRHLFNAKEMLGAQIGSIHNLAFYLWLVGEAREQILAGTFKEWKEKMVLQLGRRL